MQEIPSYRFLKPASRKIANRQDVKRVLYKSIGRASLTWNELEEVLLDVEVALNNRPLSYVEDEVLLPVLTP